MKYYIDKELGIDWQDAGPWRSFHLTASGCSEKELVEDATIAEIDQDGGELDCYGLDDCGTEVYETVMDLINETVMEWRV